MNFKKKYLKYKSKYLNLKKQYGGYDKNNYELIEIFYNDKSKVSNKSLSTTNDTKNLLKKYNLLKKKDINLVFDLHNVLDLLPNQSPPSGAPQFAPEAPDASVGGYDSASAGSVINRHQPLQCRPG